MLWNSKAIPIAALSIVLSSSASAQLTGVADLTSGLTPADLVNTVTAGSSGITFSGATYTGAPAAAGVFSGGSSVFGPFMDSGIVLSSGSVLWDTGTTNSSIGDDLFPGDPGAINGTPGDLDLNSLPGTFGYTYDAAVLEFDFSCGSLDEITFFFVFTSEEYNEYVSSFFNDVFGFYVDGVNVALVPLTTDPISVNTINNGGLLTGGYGVGGTNPGFYINNVAADLPTAGLPIEMDGMTVVLAGTTTLASAPSHHMKFAIADTGDRLLDAAVFIAANSFQCLDPLVVDLDHFRGRMAPSGDVLLSWATLAEIDNVGFNIYREAWTGRPLAAPMPGAQLINTTATIPARGTPFEATSYRWMDLTAQPGQVYSYWLEDIDLDGRSTLHGPITVR